MSDTATQPTSTGIRLNGSPTKLKNGDWGVRVTSEGNPALANVQKGDIVEITVTTKDGSKTWDQTSRCLWTGDNNFGEGTAGLFIRVKEDQPSNGGGSQAGTETPAAAAAEPAGEAGPF